MFNSLSSKAVNLNHVLTLCRSAKDLKRLKSLLVVHGLVEHELFLRQFLKSCFKVGDLDIALSTFNAVQNPTVSLQNLAIRGLSNHGLHENVLSVYVNCRLLGCPSDDFTFPFVLKACSAVVGAFGIGKTVHCAVLRNGFERNVVIQTALADFYGRSGCLRDARKLIDGIPKPDLVSWNVLIACYSLQRRDQEAFEVFRHVFELDLKPNLSTLASMIPVCTRSGCLEAGKSLHGFAIKSGCFGNDSLVPALISMYASDVDDMRLSAARKLFSDRLEKNVAVWNAMISACTQKQMPFDAIEIFREMLHADVQPDSVTFVSIIPSCAIDGSICHESVHAYVIKHGSENQISVLTGLVSLYAKLGDTNKAEFLFGRMPTRNLLSWNVMVSGYEKNGLWNACLAAFCEMQFDGFDPDAISIVSALSACSNLECTLLGKSAHAYSIRKGIESNVTLSNALLAFYSDSDHLKSSFKLFHMMGTRDAVTWHTMISACVHTGEVEMAVNLLHQMQNEGMALDLVALISILPIYSDSENLLEGMTLHCYAIKNGFASDTSLLNAFISMYCKCGDLDAGKLLFEAMLRKCVVSWNALITGYRTHKLHEEVLILHSQMVKENQRPNSVTLLNLLPICCNELQGKSIHALAIRLDVIEETPLLTSTIFMYARFENMNVCLLLFEVGIKRDISLWNAIMSMCVQRKNAAKAVSFFGDLLWTGLEPDNITILTMILACAELNSLNLAHSVMAYVVRKGLDKDVVINNALVDLYARCGSISTARELFQDLLEKNAVSWSVMINGYGLHGDGEAALGLFSQMQFSGVKPNESTFLSILSACSHAGLVKQGWMVFNLIIKCGISPRMEHYSCMVDLLGRTGHLNEAYAVVNKLPFKPPISLLDSLLGACKIHGNFELGEKIGMMLVEMDPENSQPYVMLSNLYAAAGRHSDANEVRSNIEGKGLRKVPGFSLLLRDGRHDAELVGLEGHL